LGVVLNPSKLNEWTLDGITIVVKFDKIIEVKYYKETSRILFLVGTNHRKSEILVGYDEMGNQLFKVNSPQGYSFEYLTVHPKAVMAVICGVLDIENSKEMWSDFYFSIDKDNGNLEKISVAR